MPFLEIKGLNKRFGQLDVLKDIELAVEQGGFLVLVRPSGCGKSTLLNIIAGLEPLSNLDAKLRVDMRTGIKLLNQRLRTTVVYVTHDQIEAMTLATMIAVLKDGVVQQVGSPSDIYNSPANMFVADFMGSPAMNL